MAKKKEMNRTSGTAKKKAPNMSQSERIGRQRQAAAADPGPRDRFNPAAAQGVVDTLGFGVNSSGKFEFNPIATLGMALPVGKVLKAAKALRAAGKVGKATALETRLLAKEAGKIFGGTGKKSQGLGLPMDRAVDVGGRARAESESIFPRLASSAASKGGRTLQLPDNAEARFKAIDRTFSNLGAVRPAVSGAKKVATFPKRVVGKLPESGSVEMVKKTAKQFGQKVSGKEAKMISRLLKGRGGK